VIEDGIIDHVSSFSDGSGVTKCTYKFSIEFSVSTGGALRDLTLTSITYKFVKFSFGGVSVISFFGGDSEKVFTSVEGVYVGKLCYLTGTVIGAGGAIRGII